MLDVAGVDHQKREQAFQDVVDRLPELACALHRYVAYARCLKPVAHLQQVGRHRPESAALKEEVALLVRTADVGGHDCLLVNVKSGAVWKENLHYPASWWGRRGHCVDRKLSCVLVQRRQIPLAVGSDIRRCLQSHRSVCCSGSKHQQSSTSMPAPSRPYPFSFFKVNEVHGVCCENSPLKLLAVVLGSPPPWQASGASVLGGGVGGEGLPSYANIFSITVP